MSLLLTFFKINFSKSCFRNTTGVSNGLDLDLDRHCVHPDLETLCLLDPDLDQNRLHFIGYQKMTKVAASKEKVNFCIHTSGTYYHVTDQLRDEKIECTVKYNFDVIGLIYSSIPQTSIMNRGCCYC